MSVGSRDLRVFALAALALGAPLAGWAIAEGEWRLVGLIAVAAVAPLMSQWPFATGIGAYAFLVPFDAVLALGEEVSGPTLTRYVGLAAGGVLALAALLRRRFVWPPPAFWWFLLFVVWGGATAIWAADPSLVIARIPTGASLLLLYAIAVCVRVSVREVMLASVMAVLGGVLAAGYVQYLSSQGMSFTDVATRASLVVGQREANPNDLAMALIFSLGLALGGVVGGRRWLIRLGSLAAMATIAVGIYLTMSRGAIVALAAMCFSILYRFRASVRILLPVALLGVLTLIVPDLLFERLLRMSEDQGAGRLDIWRVGIVALREYWLLGAGLDHFPSAYDEWVSFANLEGAARVSPGAHNTYLNTWVETGIVGLTLLLGACVGQLRVLSRVAPAVGSRNGAYLFALEGACVAGLVGAFFGDDVWLKVFWLQWMLLAVATQAYGTQQGLAEADPGPEEGYVGDTRGEGRLWQPSAGSPSGHAGALRWR